MALEVGGRADKEGNQYENHFLGKHLLRLAEEKLKSIEVEPLGDEGQGVEYIAVKPDDTRIYYQCKAANAAKSYWSIADLANLLQQSHPESLRFLLLITVACPVFRKLLRCGFLLCIRHNDTSTSQAACEKVYFFARQ